MGVHLRADTLVASDELEVLQRILLGRDVGGMRVVKGIDDAAHDRARERDGVGRACIGVLGVDGRPGVPQGRELLGQRLGLGNVRSWYRGVAQARLVGG